MDEQEEEESSIVGEPPASGSEVDILDQVLLQLHELSFRDDAETGEAPSSPQSRRERAGDWLRQTCHGDEDVSLAAPDHVLQEALCFR